MKTHTSTTLIDKTRGLKFTESPRWHDGRLWFLDIHDKRIKTADLDGRLADRGGTAVHPERASASGATAACWSATRCSGRFTAGMARRCGPWPTSRDITVFCLSDGIVDLHDRLYVGDIGYNFFDPANKPVDTCVIACIDPDGRARVVAKGLELPQRDRDHARRQDLDRRRDHGSPPDRVRRPA